MAPVTRINVLLISKRTPQALQLKEDLSHVAGYRLQFVETAEAAISLLVSGYVDCIVINFENFGLVQVNLVKDLKEVSRATRALIFADHADEEAVHKIKEEKSLILVEKGLLNLEKDMSGLCRRLIGGKDPIYKREGARRAANQKATIVIAESGKTVNGRMVDVSERGACLEINTNAVSVGGQVKITLELEQLERKRVLSGEICWVRPFPGRSVIGVKLFKTGSI